MEKPRNLKGRIALVAGATRGAGRGIATMLGDAGATVYCTGRSSRQRPGSRPETIEETAERIDELGGTGIPVRVDHENPEEVAALASRIREDHGRLDVLVNDIWGGESLTEWGVPFWELSLDKGFQMLRQAVGTHIITSRHLVPLMLPHPGGLIVEITDGNTYAYRGTLFYDLVKTSVARLAFAMAQDLREHGIAAVAVTPGFLRSEEMLEHFGVTEANWRDGAAVEPHFIASETPAFVGRAVASLAADPTIMSRTGRLLSSWDLSDEYGFTDIDGERPHWGRYFERTFGSPLRAVDDTFYTYWENDPTRNLGKQDD